MLYLYHFLYIKQNRKILSFFLKIIAKKFGDIKKTMYLCIVIKKESL